MSQDDQGNANKGDEEVDVQDVAEQEVEKNSDEPFENKLFKGFAKGMLTPSQNGGFFTKSVLYVPQITIFAAAILPMADAWLHMKILRAVGESISDGWKAQKKVGAKLAFAGAVTFAAGVGGVADLALQSKGVAWAFNNSVINYSDGVRECDAIQKLTEKGIPFIKTEEFECAMRGNKTTARAGEFSSVVDMSIMNFNPLASSQTYTDLEDAKTVMRTLPEGQQKTYVNYTESFLPDSFFSKASPLYWFAAKSPYHVHSVDYSGKGSGDAPVVPKVESLNP